MMKNKWWFVLTCFITSFTFGQKERSFLSEVAFLDSYFLQIPSTQKDPRIITITSKDETIFSADNMEIWSSVLFLDSLTKQTNPFEWNLGTFGATITNYSDSLYIRKRAEWIDSWLSDHCKRILKDDSSGFNVKIYADLTLNNNQSPFDSTSFNSWKNNLDRLTIKHLKLIGFSTVPAYLSVFSEVETIEIELGSAINLTGLNQFPKLTTLSIDEGKITIGPNDSWTHLIENLICNKTEIKGVYSFQQFERLKTVTLSFSGFNPFPIDFECLQQLTHFTTGAHRFGQIDLSKIHLDNLSCLRKVVFHTWYETISGIPTGLNHVQYFQIEYPQLKRALNALPIDSLR